jgi:hypothetical protein
MTNTYTKLRDGSWGVRSTEEVRPGQVVTVIKKSGDTKVETIKTIIWSGNGVWICSIVPKPARQGCSRCCRTATRTTQIWEECDHCGCEPIYI